MELLEEVLNLLNNRPHWLTYTVIAESIDVSVDWLKKLSSGKISNPGVVTIERLKDYLTEDINR